MAGVADGWAGTRAGDVASGSSPFPTGWARHRGASSDVTRDPDRALPAALHAAHEAVLAAAAANPAYGDPGTTAAV